MAYTGINKSSLYMNTKLYTGNGGTQSITGVGFKPDMVWLKKRSASGSHYITDAVRGVGKALFPDANNAEYTYSDGVTAFGTDGWTVGNNGGMNGSNAPSVGWNWKAETAFSNSAGANGATLASTGSVNDTAGFSIVSYTGNTTAGATIKHGLSTKPDVIICKARQDSGGAIEWVVYHKGIPTPQNNTLCLNTTAAKVDRTIAWNDTAPTSSVFSVGTWVGTNAQVPMIAYCFSEKTGYSKFGKYSANANVDGTFVYTGFKPSFILIKAYNAAQDGQNWFIYDSVRDTGNTATQTLQPDTDAAEETNVAPIDILSNGFKLRTNTGRINGTNGEYIFMAFGQSLVGSNNIPCTAR